MDFQEPLKKLADADYWLKTKFPNISLELARSIPMESDKVWWQCRVYLLSRDLDNTDTELPMSDRLNRRKN